MQTRRKIVKAARKSVRRGATPRYRVDLSARRVDLFPWLEFDGSRPAAIAEAARRAIAAEIGVRPDQVEVDPVADGEPRSEDQPRGSQGFYPTS